MGVLGLETYAAVEEDVSTKRFTLGSLAAASRALIAPLTALGITTVGSGLRLTFVAVWITADAPLTASSKACGASISSTATNSKLPTPYLRSNRAVSHAFLAGL